MLGSKKIEMVEQCNSCGKEVTKYVLFEVSEFEDVADDDPEIRNYYGATICNNCEMYILGNQGYFGTFFVR